MVDKTDFVDLVTSLFVEQFPNISKADRKQFIEDFWREANDMGIIDGYTDEDEPEDEDE